MPTLHPIRVSAKALIIDCGRVLCNRHADELGDWYSLPGGGQEFGETLHETLQRECLEEINAEIEIGPLLFVRDYIGKNHEFKEADFDTHQIELIFECRVLGSYQPQLGSLPDPRQLGTVWLEIVRLNEERLFPKALIPFLMQQDPSLSYLGDVN